MKPTDVFSELTADLVRRFGSWEAVPVPLRETAWLIQMRLVEAERDLEYFYERLASYTDEAVPVAPASNVARLVLTEHQVLEVEVGSPFRRGAVLYEKITFDPQALVAAGVVEALSAGRGLRLLLPDGAERMIQITDTGGLWQGKLAIASQA